MDATTKFELFVSTRVAQAPVVLFTTGDVTPVLELCRLNHVSVHHVNLDRVAGNLAISQVLQRRCNMTSPFQELLFVNATFVGDTATVVSMASTALAALLSIDPSTFVVGGTADDVVLTIDPSLVQRGHATSFNDTLPIDPQSLLAWHLDPAEATRSVPLAHRPRASNRQRSHLTAFSSLNSSPDQYKNFDESTQLSLVPWEILDAIVFTSEGFLTLPPQGFVDGAHRNGVRVLGSLTWHADSAAQINQPNDFCDWQSLALKLQTVQSFTGVDGWHLVGLSDQVAATLLPLLSPSSYVLWASEIVSSSVTTLLPLAHGVLLPAPVDKSTVVKLAKAAGDRRWQLTFALDSVAAEVSARTLRFADVSVCTVTNDPFWKTNWRSVAPVHSVYGGAEALYTAFNVGHGATTSVDGRVVSSSPWHDQGQVDVLPLLNKAKSPMHMNLSLAKAFQGGSSLHLCATLPAKARVSVDLLPLQVHFAPRKVIRVAYSFHTTNDPTSFGLVLNLVSKDEIVLRGWPSSQMTSSPLSQITSSSLSPLIGRAKHTRAYAPVSETNSPNGWITRVYQLGGALWDGHVIKGVSVFGVNLSDERTEDWSVHVGQVVVCPVAADMPTLSQMSPVITAVQIDPSTATLTWTVPSTVQYTHVFQEMLTCHDELVWVGRTNHSRWQLPSKAKSDTTFVLQPVHWTGAVGRPQRVTIVLGGADDPSSFRQT
ncbi:hypothetical protein DYB38_001806 [Aphanomyces astaci]|uniref:Cytosolic endo-beta-N-acetylglucosaminidase TIM barrel domain-containing protein n=1 Tax=Aphanomyces astaci TaxID=112090 RepID=A0A397CB69_APHAT|nr:hypothetical protein DYB38_001806 [Aphanomyces astaci]